MGSLQIAVLLLHTTILSMPYTTACERGWFGSACQYQCHCKWNLCDRNGSCISGSSCEAEWFGPGCQYQNLLRTYSYRNSMYDGECNVGANHNRTLTLTWNVTYVFTFMRIVLHRPGIQESIPSIAVTFIKNQSSSSSCQNPTLSIIDQSMFELRCDSTQQIKFTQIHLEGEIVNKFCSAFVSGGRNVALKQIAVQSSTHDKSESGAKKAVDGNRDIDYFKYSCSHTEGSGNEFWNVTLKKPATVDRFVIYNRMDVSKNGQCCPARLKGFELTATETKVNTVFRHKDTERDAKIIYTIVMDKSQQILTVNVALKNKEVNYLTMCEVEIYGDYFCEKQNYGPDCNRTCNCQHDEACFNTGVCPSGCTPGYHGEGCLKECSAGKWGVGCVRSCSDHCVDPSKCDRISGVCDGGCKSGYGNQNCDKACDDGRFGTNCSQNCSTNCALNKCNVTDGHCFNCKSGYTETFCQQQCPQKTYGQNCSLNCSEDCKDLKCDHVTGNCDVCPDGRTGLICEQACGDGRYGPMCARLCSNACRDQKCNAIHGTCFSCYPGYRGDLCQEVCPPTLYGQNCSLACNESCLDELCHHVTGSCHSCPKGSTGSLCEEKESTSPSTTSAIVSVVVLLTVIAVVLIVVVQRRRRRNIAGNLNKTDGNNSSQTDLEEIDELPLCDPRNSIDHFGIINVYDTFELENHTGICVADLGAFLQSHKSQFFQEQFYRIQVPENVTTEVGLNEENRAKNRYKNICTYDHSRVRLEINTENNEGDYINASFIQGYNKENEFIASQGPNKIMVNDFVRMLWEHKVDKVVMLTNLIEENKIKCERYWPVDGKAKFGNITVILSTTEVFAHYTIRRLELKKRHAPGQTVVHYHFTSWPDKGVPMSAWSLVDFEQRVTSCPTTRPIVVHCSAGVGRTGTFIALCNTMREAEITGNMDVFQTVTKLRKARIMMVQTAEQYEFLHRLVRIAWLCRETTVKALEITNRLRMLEYKSAPGRTQMEQEFEAVCHITEDKTVDDLESDCDSGDPSVYQNNDCLNNHRKSRFPLIKAHPGYAVKLECEESHMSDYINAVMVPSLSRIDGQILTQLPLTTTVIDFWRLVHQYNVHVIVSFELDAISKDPTIANYLSDNMDSSLFVMNRGPSKVSELWEEQVIRIKSRKSRSRSGEQVLTHIKCTFTALDPSKLLTFVKHLRTLLPKTSGRIVYTCRNGAEFSGLACALILLLDRLDNDQCLAVPLTVGALKSIRPQVIPTLTQYKILYQILDRYNETSSSYSNLGDHKLGTTGSNTSHFLDRNQETKNDTNIYTNN